MRTTMRRTVFFLIIFATAPPLLFAQRGGAPAGPQQTSTPAPLKFRYMGPAPAGRIASVAGVPGDPNVYYFGSASGGVWKTSDGGQTFVPIFDDEKVAAVGSIAVADSNPSIIWVGTGEPWVIRYSDVMGDGVYKSVDAGKTWQHMGLIETGRISRVLVHPTDPNIVYVCSQGHLTGRRKSVAHKTTDGGASWQRVLSSTAIRAVRPRHGQVESRYADCRNVASRAAHLGSFSGGPGSGVYITRDGGAKWTKVTNGMPKSPVGKIDVAVAQSNTKRMYALIQTADQGSLWRSDDAGNSWSVVSWDRSLIGRAGYYIRLAVNPRNPDDVFVMSSSLHRSQDGGKNFSGNGGGPFPFVQGQASCGDRHMPDDPKDPVAMCRGRRRRRYQYQGWRRPCPNPERADVSRM
jgi:photosystem II stability/assembly factor-like uncharacterized protein